MKDSSPNKPALTPDLAALDESELVSNQAVTPVPWFVGERKIAVEWVSPIYNLYSKDAPGATKK